MLRATCYFGVLCFSYESGILEDPQTEGPADLYQMTVAPEKAPDTPTLLEISFEKGNYINWK